MNIDRLRHDLIRLYGNRSTPAREAGAAGSRRTDEGSASRADSVSLSPQMHELRRVLNVVRQLPEIREERVAEIRQQIADGTYSINVEQLARTLTNGHR